MITYTTGNLLEANAEALVNTVNCEGYMGKGIAYQFKLTYPNNNVDYVKACKNGTLRIGTLHYYFEKGKTIINFPTKDKWREKSKIEYINVGLEALIRLINQLNIKSIAIPPLGSGNGGLIWANVKELIEEKLKDISDDIHIIVYEPSMNYEAKPLLEPKLSLSGLILMQIKHHLQKFGTLRLQKAAYYTDIFSNQHYFKFSRDKYGPYDNSIAIVSRAIKEFQKYHGVKNTDEAYEILYKKLVSDKTVTKLNALLPFVIQACTFVNSISTDHELECLATITYLIQESNYLDEGAVVDNFRLWSEDKAKRFTEAEII